MKPYANIVLARWPNESSFEQNIGMKGPNHVCQPVWAPVLRFEGSQNTRKRDENWENYIILPVIQRTVLLSNEHAAYHTPRSRVEAQNE